MLTMSRVFLPDCLPRRPPARETLHPLLLLRHLRPEMVPHGHLLHDGYSRELHHRHDLRQRLRVPKPLGCLYR